jgi:myo-inositol-1(or 4)-monophosphatase
MSGSTTGTLAQELERTAVRLVRLAGALILSLREKPGEVQFKAGPSAPKNASPASDVDRGVEEMIRDEIKRSYPDHGIIGEEIDDAPEGSTDIIWVIDPLDGTSNFLNGFPLFASTIGVLEHGRPIAAATWCMTTHMGESGVYHAHEGSGLCFDSTTIDRRKSAAWRGLAGEPGRSNGTGREWDRRVIGSAATECAFVAAGILRVSSIEYPRIWDIAGGVLLARAGGCTVYSRDTGDWKRLTRFAHGDLRELRKWRGALLIGDDDEIAGIVNGRAPTR